MIVPMKQVSLPQPMIDELNSLIEAGGGDKRTQISAPLKALYNTGLVNILPTQEGALSLYTVVLTERAAGVVALFNALEFELAWQPPKEPDLVAPPPMPAPTPLRDLSGLFRAVTGPTEPSNAS